VHRGLGRSIYRRDVGRRRLSGPGAKFSGDRAEKLPRRENFSVEVVAKPIARHAGLITRATDRARRPTRTYSPKGKERERAFSGERKTSGRRSRGKRCSIIKKAASRGTPGTKRAATIAGRITGFTFIFRLAVRSCAVSAACTEHAESAGA